MHMISWALLEVVPEHRKEEALAMVGGKKQKQNKTSSIWKFLWKQKKLPQKLKYNNNLNNIFSEIESKWELSDSFINMNY